MVWCGLFIIQVCIYLKCNILPVFTSLLVTRVPQLQEKILLAKIRQKDPDAYAQVYDTHIDGIYRFIYFKVPTTEIAEDVTSEVFLKAWEYLTANEGRSVKHLRAFLYTIARNKVTDYYRKKALGREISLEGARPENQPNLQTRELGLTFREDANPLLQKQIRKLKDEYQEIILLRFVEDLTIKEIARVVGKSNGAIRVTIHRALKALKLLIEEEQDLET